jgi:endonuclease/exonuclease/phosphatase family metal-dependent hydrolase
MINRIVWQHCLVALLFLAGAPSLNAETFRIATYNLENYIDQPTETRTHAKSPESRAKIRESIRAISPDVIAFEEIGTISAFQELRQSLKTDGLDFPYWEHVSGFDTNINVAILSKFPIVARRPHSHESYLLAGRRFSMSRGVAEIDVQVNPHYAFTLLAAHLKSKRPVPEADQAEQRLEEGRILRGIIDAILSTNAEANLVVVGDFNDTPDSPSTKVVVGIGRMKLVDTRPAERNGDTALTPPFPPRRIVWTHYYGKEDSYSRIDYILLSAGMAREWQAQDTFIPTVPNWGVASDHRPIVATFEAVNR